ncbi:MAG: hypothetical protein IIV29_05960, partial [Tidjanibacter sp.]|nr:hypothetical protein [Tidjanibacter sp.]
FFQEGTGIKKDTQDKRAKSDKKKRAKSDKKKSEERQKKERRATQHCSSPFAIYSLLIILLAPRAVLGA